LGTHIGNGSGVSRIIHSIERETVFLNLHLKT
jgi:hypothetical protein